MPASKRSLYKMRRGNQEMMRRNSIEAGQSDKNKVSFDLDLVEKKPDNRNQYYRKTFIPPSNSKTPDDIFYERVNKAQYDNSQFAQRTALL